MANRIPSRVLSILPVLGLLMLVTGCDTATDSSSPADLIAVIQDFAREALAAFLF